VVLAPQLGPQRLELPRRQFRFRDRCWDGLGGGLGCRRPVGLFFLRHDKPFEYVVLKGKITR